MSETLHFRPSPTRRGFSLIELMIAVAVMAVIVAIAVPTYQGTVRKSRRAEATASLTAIMQAQERWRSNNPAYCTELTAAPTDDPAGLGQSDSTSGGYYTLALSNVGANGYTVTATATAGKSQAEDGDCATLRIRMNAGNINYGSASGWDDAASRKCWAR
ncbi:MAG: type IV pilin protein [Rubrivivax sp.]|nr:type IV pilin protein [Rubrivivax sp.]